MTALASGTKINAAPKPEKPRANPAANAATIRNANASEKSLTARTSNSIAIYVIFRECICRNHPEPAALFATERAVTSLILLFGEKIETDTDHLAAR